MEKRRASLEALIIIPPFLRDSVLPPLMFVRINNLISFVFKEEEDGKIH
jgi:hypothetical protein